METGLVAAADDVRVAVDDALDAFVTGGLHRSAGAVVLRGPELAVVKGERERYPAASLIKVVMAMALYDQATEGVVSLDSTVERAALGETVYASVLSAFDGSREFSLRELCALMLITSDNPASDEVLRVVTVDGVNEALTRLGAANTRMGVGFGDDQVGGEGRSNVTTVPDMFTILRGLYTNSRYEPVVQAMRNNVRNMRIPLRLPDTQPIAHKTGSLEGLAHNAGIVYGERVDLALVFLAMDEKDTAMTSIAMGDCTARVWAALGELVST